MKKEVNTSIYLTDDLMKFYTLDEALSYAKNNKEVTKITEKEIFRFDDKDLMEKVVWTRGEKKSIKESLLEKKSKMPPKNITVKVSDLIKGKYISENDLGKVDNKDTFNDVSSKVGDYLDDKYKKKGWTWWGYVISVNKDETGKPTEFVCSDIEWDDELEEALEKGDEEKANELEKEQDELYDDAEYCDDHNQPSKAISLRNQASELQKKIDEGKSLKEDKFKSESSIKKFFKELKSAMYEYLENLDNEDGDVFADTKDSYAYETLEQEVVSLFDKYVEGGEHMREDILSNALNKNVGGILNWIKKQMKYYEIDESKKSKKSKKKDKVRFVGNPEQEISFFNRAMGNQVATADGGVGCVGVAESNKVSKGKKLNEAPDSDGIPTDDELADEEARMRADFEAKMKARRDNVAQQRQDRDDRNAKAKARQQELEAKYSKALEEIGDDWSMEHLTDVLMPASGKSDSLGGELVRAFNRLDYRYFNDGDYFFEGYGLESSAGKAGMFLMEKMRELSGDNDKYPSDSEFKSKCEEIFNTLYDAATSCCDVSKDSDMDAIYENMLEELGKQIVDLIKSYPSLLGEETEDMLKMEGVEEFMSDEDLIPRYEIEISAPDLVYHFLQIGLIDENRIEEEVDSWISNTSSSAGDDIEIYVDSYGDVTVSGLSRTTRDWIEWQDWYDDWVDNQYGLLSDDYGCGKEIVVFVDTNRSIGESDLDLIDELGLKIIGKQEGKDCVKGKVSSIYKLVKELGDDMDEDNTFLEDDFDESDLDLFDENEENIGDEDDYDESLETKTIKIKNPKKKREIEIKKTEEDDLGHPIQKGLKGREGKLMSEGYDKDATDLFDEFVNSLEFYIIKNEDGTYSLRDQQEANLGDIESETYDDIFGIANRLGDSAYLEDYYLNYMTEDFEDIMEDNDIEDGEDFDTPYAMDDFIKLRDIDNWIDKTNPKFTEKFIDDVKDFVDANKFELRVFDLLLSTDKLSKVNLDEIAQEVDDTTRELGSQKMYEMTCYDKNSNKKINIINPSYVICSKKMLDKLVEIMNKGDKHNRWEFPVSEKQLWMLSDEEKRRVIKGDDDVEEWIWDIFYKNNYDKSDKEMERLEKQFRNWLYDGRY